MPSETSFWAFSLLLWLITLYCFYMPVFYILISLHTSRTLQHSVYSGFSEWWQELQFSYFKFPIRLWCCQSWFYQEHFLWT
jgi:hypothetical protein